MNSDHDYTLTQATLMLVDDQPAVLGLLTGHLEHHGYDVVIAQDGDEALERAALVQPDLILMDVVMPGLSGFDTCRRLKADPAARDVPVIFMTSLTETPQKLLGFQAGAVDYLTKPVDLDEALVRIRTHLTLHDLKRRLQTQNERLAGEIEERRRAQAELQRSNAALDRLAAAASHDLQEPLLRLADSLGAIELHCRGQLDGEGLELIGDAIAGAQRLRSRIDELLSDARAGRSLH